MQILDFEKLPSPQLGATIITIGNFDGVHAGHQELIRCTVADAHNRKVKSVVVTFHPHPATYFNPERVPPSICSREYKQRLIQTLGVDAMLTLSFNADMAKLEAEEYVTKILLNKLNAKVICIGYDFTFGCNREGNVRLLIELGEKYHFQTTVLSPQRVDGFVVSSTKIREFILQGNVEQAARLLRRKHLLQGIVVAGDKEGRELGFPTININVVEGLIPGRGIYSGIVSINTIEYPAAIYIGSRPTYKNSNYRVEAHLLGFSGDLYGADIAIAFLKFIRDEIKFKSIQTLKNRVKLDCEISEKDFNDYIQDRKTIPVIW